MRVIIKWGRGILIGLALGVAMLACGRLVSDPVIDSWPIGAPTTDCVRGSCEVMIDAAGARLDIRNRGHADVVKVTIYEIGRFVNDQGQVVLTTTSGGPTRVVVFELADGSRRAIGVGYPGISKDPVGMDEFCCGP